MMHGAQCYDGEGRLTCGWPDRHTFGRDIRDEARDAAYNLGGVYLADIHTGTDYADPDEDAADSPAFVMSLRRLGII